ncbi:hypothetical protein ACS0TY_001177 [Phlomoides rotata]
MSLLTISSKLFIIMNRIVKVVYTKAIANNPKFSGGFSVLQNENSQKPMKFQGCW